MGARWSGYGDLKWQMSVSCRTLALWDCCLSGMRILGGSGLTYLK